MWLFPALGDVMFKVPIDLVRALSMMWGFPVFPDTIDRWTHQKHTPPHISSRPSVKHFPFKKGDKLVICSDGLRTSLTARKECPTKMSGIRLYLSLAWIPWMHKLYYHMKRLLAIPSYLLQILLILQMECFGMCCSVSMIIAWQRKLWPRWIIIGSG